MAKTARHALIQELLRTGPIPSQEEVRRALEQRGMRANQATISRDFKELGLVKTGAGYVLPGHQPSNGNPPDIKLEHVYSLDVGGNLIVLKTAPGLASPTAIQIDRSGHPDLLGTVAGDDTIFVAARSPEAARRLAKLLANGVIA